MAQNNSCSILPGEHNWGRWCVCCTGSNVWVCGILRTINCYWSSHWDSGGKEHFKFTDDVFACGTFRIEHWIHLHFCSGFNLWFGLDLMALNFLGIAQKLSMQLDAFCVSMTTIHVGPLFHVCYCSSTVWCLLVLIHFVLQSEVYFNTSRRNCRVPIRDGN